MRMQRIVVLESQGRLGQDHHCINLAGYYALQGERPSLMDYDPQASATNGCASVSPASRSFIWSALPSGTTA